MSKRQARRVSAVEVPAASAKVAAAEVAAAQAAKVAAPEAAHVAESAAGESSSAAPEAVTVAVASTVAAIVTRTPSIPVTVVRVPRTVVAGAGTIGRPVVIAAAIIWIARGRAKDAADDRRAGVVAISVGVTMPVAPYVMMAVRVRDAAIGMPGPAVDRMCGVMDDRRRAGGGERRQRNQSGRAERDGRNAKSAVGHGKLPSSWAAERAARNAPVASEIGRRRPLASSGLVTNTCA